MTSASAAAVADLHVLLLALTGRLPDPVLSVARALLAEGWSDAAAESVLDALLEAGTAVSEGERDLLAVVLTARQRELDLLDAVPVVAGDPWADAPAPVMLGDVPDAADEALRAVLRGVVGAVGAWRADLASADGDARPVWFVEVADRHGADLAAVAGALDRALVEAGVPGPALDVVDREGRAPARAVATRAAGRPVWPIPRARGFRIARIYDGLDDAGGPCFEPDRDRLDGARRLAVLSRLRRGGVVLAGERPLDDLVAPAEGVVPNVFRTDGRWIWHEAVAHYLAVYGIAPEPDLLVHLEDGDAPAEVAGDVCERALAALQRV